VNRYPRGAGHKARMFQTHGLQLRGSVTNGAPGSMTLPLRVSRSTAIPGRVLVRASPLAAAIGADRMPNRHYGTADRRVPRIRWLWALAAVGAVGISASAVDPMRAHTYETALGEHRTIGCGNNLITLDTRSRVAIQCARNLLRASVLRGGASFRVAHDYSSAAIVLAGDARVEGIGTAFAVLRDADRSVVTVAEGSVTLSALDSSRRAAASPDGGPGRSPTPARTIDEMTLRSGERAAVVSRGSQVFLAIHEQVGRP
jgi:ferric-dicitrate binding protein FerR (iron transport regulator)